MTDSLNRAIKHLELYDRVHEELECGKAFEDIDHGLREEGHKMTYGYWRSYLTATILNGLRSHTRELKMTSKHP